MIVPMNVNTVIGKLQTRYETVMMIKVTTAAFDFLYRALLLDDVVFI